MTGNSTRYTDNIIHWGWREFGHGPVGVHIRVVRAGVSKTARTATTTANQDYPPLGKEAAVTCDRGLALLSSIAGM
jgi:hypothetical protein